MNQTISLESLIDNNFDVILTKDCNVLNAGSVLWKNSAWTHSFLQQVFDVHNNIDVDNIEYWWENAAILHLHEGFFIIAAIGIADHLNVQVNLKSPERVLSNHEFALHWCYHAGPDTALDKIRAYHVCRTHTSFQATYQLYPTS